MINVNDLIEEYGIDIDFVATKLGMNIKHKGSYMFTNCPMSDHDDNNPSAYYKSGDKALYCPGCVKSISIITMIEEMEGLDFKGAAKWLEDAVGITPEQKKGFHKKRINYSKQSKEMTKGMNLIKFHYPKMIQTPDGEKKFSLNDFMSEKEKKALLKSMTENEARKTMSVKGYCETQGIVLTNVLDQYMAELGKFHKVLKQ